MKKLLTIFLITIVHSVYGMPPTDYFTTVANGDWSTNGTWDTGTPPPNDQTGGNDDITIDHNVTLTAPLDMKSGTIITINAGDTLTVNGDVDFNNGCVLVVNGVLIINGNVANSNNSDNVTINGEIIIDGNYDGGTGSDLGGTGGMEITGEVTTDGDATVFGSGVDCTVDCDNSDSEPLSDPLPIELVFFKGSLDEDGYTNLEWLTGSEINNDYFEIIRSNSVGTIWKTIGSVYGVGNSNSPQFYSFIDTSPNHGYNYYKLIQYDFDGKREEHEMVVILVEHEYTKGFTIYPNPAPYGDDISVRLNGFRGQETLIIVMDALGKIYYEKAVLSSKDNDIIVIDSKLSTGTYLIVGSERHELYRRKLIIR